jgi:SAM-dependent methyltransferase
MEEGQRGRLRETFDDVALLYDEVRPGYPQALFDDLVSLSGVPPGGRILEIGCGTGQATLPLARRGYRMLCVELGEHLAAVARRNLAPYPQVAVLTRAFEDWSVEEGAFDLAISATAFHWIDETLRYERTARALKPGGAVAPFWNLHVHTDRGGGFFEEVQEVYERVAPEIADPASTLLPWPDHIPESEAGRIGATGLFGPATVRRYAWEVEYDAAAYIRVLDTYSGHRSLDSATRQRLFEGIARLIDTRYGGRITKGYLSMLYVARRL